MPFDFLIVVVALVAFAIFAFRTHRDRAHRRARTATNALIAHPDFTPRTPEKDGG